MTWSTTQFVAVLGLLALVRIERSSAGHAHSFAHFHGPVEGPGHEVSVHDKHGHHSIDYVAHPKYEFAYGVEDHHTGDYHGQKEHRDGNIFFHLVTFFVVFFQFIFIDGFVSFCLFNYRKERSWWVHDKRARW